MIQMLTDSSARGQTEELYSHRDEKVFCNEVAREAINHTYGHFPELSIVFKSSLPDSLFVHTNHLYLMRSLREILYNSAKYSDGQHILLQLSETESSIQFIFQDTGPGIAEEYHELMFAPFTKINDLSEGLGLGLSLAKRHIKNLGGDLILDTTYHDGCRFIIDIPKH